MTDELDITPETEALIYDMLYDDKARNESLTHMYQYFGRTVTPDDASDFADWCINNVYSGESALSKSYDINLTPYFRRIAHDYLFNPDVKQINVLASTGAGKTALMTAMLNYTITYDHGPTIVCFQQSKEANTFAETRLYPTLVNNPKLAGMIPDKRNGQRKTELILPTAPVFFVGASPTQLQSKSMRYVISDECWCYKDGMIRELKARTHDRYNAKILLMSQAASEGTQWYDEYTSGIIYDYGWYCPECKSHHIYDISYFKFDKSKELTIKQKASTTRLVCPSCNHEISDTVKNRRNLAMGGDYIRITPDDVTSDIHSYHANAFAISRISWSTLIEEFLNAAKIWKEDNNFTLLEKFNQKRLAKFTKSADDHSDREIKNASIVPTYTNDRKIGQIDDPNTIVAQYLFVDVQQDSYWWQIINYLDDNKCYLIDCGNAISIDELLEIKSKYPKIKGNTFLDAAYNTTEVRQNCVRLNAYPINSTAKETYKHGKTDKLYKIDNHIVEYLGKKHKLKQINFSSQGAKDLLYNYCKQGNFLVPQNVPSTFKSQMANEIRSSKKDLSGNLVRYWSCPTNKNNSHLLDCSAMMVIVLQINNYID